MCRAVAAAALAAHGLAPRVALTLGSTEAVKEAVAAGLGRVREVRVAGPDIRRPLTRLRLAGRPPSAPAAASGAPLATAAGAR